MSVAVVTLRQPPRIVFGVGCTEAAAEELAERRCRQVALVGSARAQLQAAPLRARLSAFGITCHPVTEVPPEPTIAAFETARRELRRHPVDAVIGFGGGSALDIAKLLAALGSTDTAVHDVVGIGRLAGRALPLLCLPTTAGTGSEVSPNAILLDEAAQLKVGVISPHLVPDSAYVDPQLTVPVPPGLTAATGVDALVHCIEAFANRHAHPLVDVQALAGIRLIATHLPAAVRDGRDLAARTAVARGSLHGGLCLGPVNTAAVHALSYPLGSRFHVPHGLANALLLPYVLRFNLPAAPDRYAEIARAVGVEAPPGDDARVAAAGIVRLEQLLQECGIPRHLGACGVTSADIPALVAGAMQVTRLLRNNVREVTAADATEIYRAALTA